MASSSGSFFDPSRMSKASAQQYSSSDSDSDDERLLPGEDHDDFGDFNPRKKRRLGGNNKERAALGIFGSDSDDGDQTSKWKRKTLRNKAMSFVTTTTDKPAAENSDDDSEDARPVLGNTIQDDDEDDESDEEASAGVGLGFGRHGLGSTAREIDHEEDDEEESKPSRPSFATDFRGGGVLGVGFVPSSAAEPVLKEPQGKSCRPPPQNKPQPSAFGPKTKGKINAKSFGARMMAKMGYVEGKGLGKEGQGRNVIIEAHLRPQGVGLGAVQEKSEHEKKEEKRQAEMRGETIIDSDEEEKKRKARDKARRKGLTTATSSGGSTPRRQKTRYLTADQIRTAAPGMHIPEAFAPILDMTGPGSRMLTSTSGIMTPTSGEAESKEVIESRKLVKRAQADLMAFTEEWRSLEERKKWIDLELAESEREVEELRVDFSRLKAFSTLVVGRITTATTFGEVMGALSEVEDLGSAVPEVADIIVAAIHPFFKGWDPLTEPGKFATELKGLAGILMGNQQNGAVSRNGNTLHDEPGVYRRHKKATTPYETLMYKSWLPQVLAAVRSWDAFTPGPVLEVMESWDALLPPFVRAQAVDGIARKLDATLSDWNPRAKTQSPPPHLWLFPWLPHLPAYHLDPRGTGLVADVRRKFRQLLDAWDYARGVVPGLAAWEAVLGAQWRPLLVAHALPAMGRHLQRHFRVDPADQAPYLPALSGALRWRAVLGDAVLAEVLAQHLFPMWHRKLQEWLALDEVNLSEVADWYAWWRDVVLKDIAGASESVGVELDRGLRIMNMVC